MRYHDLDRDLIKEMRGAAPRSIRIIQVVDGIRPDVVQNYLNKHVGCGSAEYYEVEATRTRDGCVIIKKIWLD
ncbi:MAG: hypothetical protein J4473_00145 [Candidatus Aenigmarchaeota archaeon]|nr:hypothetical protein [Candidatus Aenigmarchaeota archaeon]